MSPAGLNVPESTGIFTHNPNLAAHHKTVEGQIDAGIASRSTTHLALHQLLVGVQLEHRSRLDKLPAKPECA